MNPDPTTRLTLLSAPLAEPVTLDEAKQFLRIEHNADDANVTRAIAAARQAAEQFLHFLLLPQQWRFSVSRLCHILALPVGPAQAVSAITAYDHEGASHIVAPEHYRLTLDGHGIIFSQVPTGREFSIALIIGAYADAAAIPAGIKQGLINHVAAILENRQGALPLPQQSISCYQPYRRVRL